MRNFVELVLLVNAFLKKCQLLHGFFVRQLNYFESTHSFCEKQMASLSDTPFLHKLEIFRKATHEGLLLPSYRTCLLKHIKNTRLSLYYAPFDFTPFCWYDFFRVSTCLPNSIRRRL